MVQLSVLIAIGAWLVLNQGIWAHLIVASNGNGFCLPQNILGNERPYIGSNKNRYLKI